MIEDFVHQGNRVEKCLKLCFNGARTQGQRNGSDFNSLLPSSNFEDISDLEDSLDSCTINGSNLLWNDLSSDQLLAANTTLKSIMNVNFQKRFYLDELDGNEKVLCIVL